MNMNMILYGVLVVALLMSSVEMKSLQQQQSEQWQHQEDYFKNLTSPPYNLRVRPYATSRMAVRVNSSMYIYSISSIDELHTEYSMQLLYRQTWYDERLRFHSNVTLQKIVGDNYHAQTIWTPSIHAVNDKDGVSFGPDGKGETLLMHINRDGRVLLSKRMKLRTYCEMEFYRYPMDDQECTLEIESSTLSSDDLELTWYEDKALEFKKDFVISGYVLTNYSLERRIINYRETGNFSRISVRFELQREFGHFVLDIYIPSILFVVTSWLSFWVEIPAAPARVTLSMTTMLTLVTSEKAIRAKLPKVSYVHALDIWNVVCSGFVFASLVEYALVNYIYHKDKRRRKSKETMKRVESTATFTSVESDVVNAPRLYTKKGETESGIPMKKVASLASLSDIQSPNHTQVDSSCSWLLQEFKMTPQDIANSIDRKCRYIFPAGFLVFNIIYWLALWL